MEVARFGEYALLTGVAFFLATINGAGVQQALLSQSYDRGPFFFNSARMLNLISVATLSLLSLLVAYFCGFENIISAIAIFIAFSLRDFGKKELVARSQHKGVLAVEISTSIFLWAFTFALFELMGFKNPELVYLISLICSCLTLLSVIAPEPRYVSKYEVIQILRFVKWVLPATILSLIGVPLFPILIGLFLGLESVGVFRGLQNIFGISNVVNQVCDMWLQPKSRDLKSENSINKTQAINLSMLFIVGFFIYAFGDVLFELVYGDDFVASKQFNANLVLATYTLFAVSVPLTVERIRAKVFGKPTYVFKSSLFYFMMCLLSYVSFLFFYSYSGVVWLLALCSSLTSLYLFFLVRNERN